jgi:hypothetical protein
MRTVVLAWFECNRRNCRSGAAPRVRAPRGPRTGFGPSLEPMNTRLSRLSRPVFMGSGFTGCARSDNVVIQTATLPGRLNAVPKFPCCSRMENLRSGSANSPSSLMLPTNSLQRARNSLQGTPKFPAGSAGNCFFPKTCPLDREKNSLPAGKSAAPRRRRSDDLVAQHRLAAPETVEIIAQDFDDVVFVPPGLSRGVRGDQHVLHAP